MKVNLICLIIFVTFVRSIAIPIDTPSIKWHQTFNCHDSGGSESDIGYFVEPISDGSGIYVGGATNSLGPNSYNLFHNSDAFVMKFDPQGVVQWYRTVGIAGSGTKGRDYTNVIRETTDGGVIMPVSMDDTTTCVIARFDKNGTSLWQRTISVGKKYSISDIRQTSDSGFVMTGGIESSNRTKNAVWIIKFDKSGSKLWEKQYQLGTATGIGLIPDQIQDNFIVVADADTSTYDPMYAISTPYNYAWLLKINSAGDTVWTKRYQGLNPVSASQIGDSAFILASTSTKDSQMKTSAQIARFSIHGDSLWVRSVSRMENNTGKTVTALGNGNVLLSGSFVSANNLNRGTWLICYGPNGDSLWCSEYVNRNRQISSIGGVQKNSYIVVGGGIPEGFKSGDGTNIWMLKGKDGSNIDFEKFIGGRSNDLSTSLIVRNSGFFIVGSFQKYLTSTTVIIRTDNRGNLLWKKDFATDIGRPFKDTGNTWLFAGLDSTGFFVASTDTLANLNWKKTVHRDTTRSYYKTCFPAKNGGYYLVGVVNWSTGVLIRLDENLNEVWFKSYPNLDFNDGLQQRNQNLAFLTESAQLISTDTLGNVVWSYSAPMPAGNYVDGIHGTKVVQIADGHLTIFAGISSGPYHQYIIHVDVSGKELWHKVYDNKYPWDENVLVVNDNEYLIAGSTAGNRNKYIAYLDSSAQFKWEKTFSENDSLRDMIEDFHVLPSGNIIAIYSEENSTYKDWDIGITELQENVPIEVLKKSPSKVLQPSVYINKNRISIKLPVTLSKQELVSIEIFSLDGKCILKRQINPNCAELVIDNAQNKVFSSGLRMIKITINNYKWIYQFSQTH